MYRPVSVGLGHPKPIFFMMRSIIFFSPVISTTVWKHYFKLKSGVFNDFANGMKNMHLEMDKILKLFDIDGQNGNCKYEMYKY